MFLWKACSFWLAFTVVGTNLKCCLIIWNNFTCFCSFRSKMTSFEHPYKWNFKRKSSLLGMLKMCYFRSRWTNTFKDIRPAYKHYMKRSMLTMQNVRVKSEQDWPIWGWSPTRSVFYCFLVSFHLCVSQLKKTPTGQSVFKSCCIFKAKRNTPNFQLRYAHKVSSAAFTRKPNVIYTGKNIYKLSNKTI